MKYCILILLLCITIGCGEFPRDPDKTLQQVKGGKLLIGYSENPPWVIKTNKDPTGIEADLLKAFAKSLQATIVWQNDSEEDLFNQLEERKLHLVIGGLTDKNAWSKHAAFTRPYLEYKKQKHVMAVLKGENAFVLHLEKFLHQHKPQPEAALTQ